MLVSESNHNRKLIINPEFKKQLLRLKKCAHAELNIHVSLDKMVTDKQYRLTVLNELDGLGSDVLNRLVRRLKDITIYTHQTQLQTKNSLLFITFIAALFMMLVTVFVSWQMGYLYISLDPRADNETLQAPRILARPNSSDVLIGPLPSVPSASFPIPFKKAIVLPSSERVIKLRLHGSNTVGEKLAPALLEAYLRSQSVTQMRWVEGDIATERELQYVQDGQVYAIQLYAHGSKTGFTALLSGNADICMSSRKINKSEITALKTSKGDLLASNQEFIIGLDGVAIIVHKDNPLDQLGMVTLAKIFSGEINNWQQLGGADMAINLYVRDENSGTWDTFNSLLLKAHNKQLSDSSLRFESSSELSAQVALDPAAIGFIGLPYVNNSKVLALSATEESTVIYPTRFTVSTEDYVLSRRLYFYTPSSHNKTVQQFSQFVLSEQGQSVVEKVGLVSLNIKLEEAYIVKNAPKIYNDYAQIASRLSVNFRFKSGSNELGNKAKLDIKRLVDYLGKRRVRRIVLMGFSDSLEDPKTSLSLSFLRARKLEKALNAYGLIVTAVEGFGEKLPIASNKTVRGRSKNRRVEVWVF